MRNFFINIKLLSFIFFLIACGSGDDNENSARGVDPLIGRWYMSSCTIDASHSNYDPREYHQFNDDGTWIFVEYISGIDEYLINGSGTWVNDEDDFGSISQTYTLIQDDLRKDPRAPFYQEGGRSEPLVTDFTLTFNSSFDNFSSQSNTYDDRVCTYTKLD